MLASTRLCSSGVAIHGQSSKLATRSTILRLPSCSAVKTSSPAKSSTGDDESLDTGAIVKYLGAVPLQTGLMTGGLFVLGQASGALAGVDSLPLDVSGETAAKALVTLYFLVTSIKSRIFSPLPADRPTIKGEKKTRESRKQPWWCPPPFVFPIVWSTIALLRCTSSVMVWEALDHNTVTLPLIVMAFHLACGDCFNHINNIEKRQGVAVSGVATAFLSCVAVVSAYYSVDSTAGLILAPSAVWIGVASCLIYSFWDLNGREGKFYPTKGESERIAAAAAAAAGTQ